MSEEWTKKDAALKEKMVECFKNLSSTVIEPNPEHMLLKGICFGLVSAAEIAAGYGCHAEDVSEYKTASVMKNLKRSLLELVSVMDKQLGSLK